jgi:hypothetical protein
MRFLAAIAVLCLCLLVFLLAGDVIALRQRVAKLETAMPVEQLCCPNCPCCHPQPALPRRKPGGDLGDLKPTVADHRWLDQGPVTP